MKIDIVVPSAGESVTEAIIAQVMKENGSFVNKEEEILELAKRFDAIKSSVPIIQLATE